MTPSTVVSAGTLARLSHKMHATVAEGKLMRSPPDSRPLLAARATRRVVVGGLGPVLRRLLRKWFLGVVPVDRLQAGLVALLVIHVLGLGQARVVAGDLVDVLGRGARLGGLALGVLRGVRGVLGGRGRLGVALLTHGFGSPGFVGAASVRRSSSFTSARSRSSLSLMSLNCFLESSSSDPISLVSLISSPGVVHEAPTDNCALPMAFCHAATVVLRSLVSRAGVALDGVVRVVAVHDHADVAGRAADHGEVAAQDVRGGRRPPPGHALAALGEVHAVLNGGGAGALRSGVPRHAGREAGAPRDADSAIDATAPVVDVGAAVAVRRVLVDAEVLAAVGDGVSPCPAVARGSERLAVLVVRLFVLVPWAAVVRRDAEVLVAQLPVVLRRATGVVDQVPDLLAARDDPVRVVDLALLLLLHGRGAVAPDHEVALTLLDVGLLGRGTAVGRQAVLVLGLAAVEAVVLELLVAGAAVVDVPTRLVAGQLALGGAPRRLSLIDEPVTGGVVAVVLGFGETLPVRDRTEGFVLIPEMLFGFGEVAVAHSFTTTCLEDRPSDPGDHRGC